MRIASCQVRNVKTLIHIASGSLGNQYVSIGKHICPWMNEFKKVATVISSPGSHHARTRKPKHSPFDFGSCLTWGRREHIPTGKWIVMCKCCCWTDSKYCANKTRFCCHSYSQSRFHRNSPPKNQTNLFQRIPLKSKWTDSSFRHIAEKTSILGNFLQQITKFRMFLNSGTQSWWGVPPRLMCNALAFLMFAWTVWRFFIWNVFLVMRNGSKQISTHSHTE